MGVTLLNALFMDEFMPVEVLLKSISKYHQKYPFLSLIKAMVSESPPDVGTILHSFPSPSSTTLEESSNIESLRYRMKPQDESFVLRKKSIAEGYYLSLIHI